MNHRRHLISAALLWSGLLFSPSQGNAQEVEMHSLLGKPGPKFEVIDSRGQKRTLAEFKGKPVVLEWTSPSCPFSKAQYESGVMQEVQKAAAAQGVVWLTVLSSHPSRAEYLPPAKAEAFNRARGAASAALLIDAEGTMGKAYGAVVTPQVFILDASGVVVYSGGVSEPATMDARQVKTLRNLVKAALDDMKAGRKVAIPTSRPLGCAVAYHG